MKLSVKTNAKCKKCTGKNPWNKDKRGLQIAWNRGIKWLAQTGELNPFYGKKHTDETKQILSQKAMGREGGFKSEHCTEEMRINLRSKRVAELLEKGVFKCPNYNKSACKIFEEINNELKWNGQFATNNDYGEYYIKELGYWLDFYEPTLNIVVEFYEKKHKYPKNASKDLIREDRIKKFLNCEFYIIKEWENKTWKDILSHYLF